MPGLDRRRRGWACFAGVSTLALMSVSTLEPGWRDLSLTTPQGGRFSIGAIRLAGGFGGAAFAQDGQSVSLENVVLALGPTTYRLPKLEFTGAALGRADLAALLVGSSAEPISDRLGRLTARQMSAPELVVEQQVGPERQTTRYRNLVASDLREGRIASLTVETGAVEITGGPGGAVSGTLGRVMASDLDLAAAARLVAEQRTAPVEALQRIAGAFSAEDIALRTDKDAEIRVGRIAGRDFFARPTTPALAETLKRLGRAEQPDGPSPAEQAKLLAALAEAMEAATLGSFEAAGIEIRDATGGQPAMGRVARMVYTGAAAGRPAEARVEGFEIAARDGRARIGVIAFTGFGWGSTLQGLKDLAARPPAEADAAALRKLIPTIGTVRLSGLDFDLPDETGRTQKPQNIRFGVKDVEVTADAPLNGIPTNLRLAVDGLTFTVPGDTTDQGLKDLAALGYGVLDLSWTTAATWNEPGGELIVREVSLRGRDMGSFTLRGVLGNVTKDAFNPDSAIALVALVGATAKTLDVTVEDGGLFQRVIDQEATKTRRSGEALRREYGTAAAIAVPTMLGNSAAAKSIGQAVARFIAKPGRLRLSARTRDAAGLGIADLALLDQPAAVLDRLEVTATAE